MAEPEVPVQAKSDILTAASPWADTLSKAVAGLAVALYASGFLVVSLHHSNFGFVGTNPFRPRVLAAGFGSYSLCRSHFQLPQDSGPILGGT
jgi:hypothetical protein